MTIHLYPGVFVEEVSFRARPIDGVDTSTAGIVAARDAARLERPPHTPEWTEPRGSDPGDPGVTLLQLFAFLGEGIAHGLGAREPSRDRALMTEPHDP